MTDPIGATGSAGPDWDEIQRRQQAASSAPSAIAHTAPSRAPWSYGTSAIPEAVRNYDPSMFAKTSATSAVTTPAAPALAKAPDPLPPAADAYHGIQLMCLAEDLPAMTRSDAKNAFTVGGYRMQPVVRVHDDGSASLLYWVAVNKESKRGEFVVGPRELETFKANVTAYERAGATAYMNGEPNEWQRQSLKTVDDAMRKGMMWGLQSLNRAWLEAVKDPSFWGQTALNVATAMAGAGAAGRVEAEIEEEAPKRLPEGPGAHSPTVEGGLKAHEGGRTRGHTLDKHVGKTEAELRARYRTKQDGTVKGPEASSSFYNRAIAEENIAKTMQMNEAAIKEWLATPDGEPKLTMNYSPTNPAFPVGIRVTGPTGALETVAGTRVTLVRDASTAAGFRIFTAFPIP